MLHTVLLIALCCPMAAQDASKIYLTGSVSSKAPMPSNQDSDVFVPLCKYLQKGDADSFSAWFADIIDLQMLTTTKTCSRNQACEIMREFFRSYSPKEVQTIYKGGEYPHRYCIVNYFGGGETFRVTMAVQSSESGNWVELLKVEKQ
ncbi:MAG: DUF4783 domain-containing protein [Bacteroidales bacterium]|nr:DUF4783 domain-containing protein [Bacteroidales bacterium]